MNYSVFRHQSYFAWNYIDRGYMILSQIKHLQSLTHSFVPALNGDEGTTLIIHSQFFLFFWKWQVINPAWGYYCKGHQLHISMRICRMLLWAKWGIKKSPKHLPSKILTSRWRDVIDQYDLNNDEQRVMATLVLEAAWCLLQVGKHPEDIQEELLWRILYNVLSATHRFWHVQ